MLTDYSVHCPNDHCGCAGVCFPRERMRTSSGEPARRIIGSVCRRCQREWQARIVGDDAIPLPQQPAAEPVG